MLKIRKSSADDKDMILALAESIDDKIHLDKKRDRLEKAIGSVELLCAEIDDEFAGFMYAYFKGPGDFTQSGSDELHISAIGVVPGQRRKGVASGLIKYILDKTDKPITADIDHGNFKAISLFTSIGFKIVSKNDEQVKMGYGQE